MEVVMKAYLQGNDSAVEVRRIPISVASQGSNGGVFAETMAKVRNAFPALADKIFALSWKDSDGDLIMMSSDEEILEAVSQCHSNPLKVYIAVEGVKDTESDKAENMKANESQQPKSGQSKTSSHQREASFGAGWPFMGPLGMPFPPPPPDCHFGEPMNFYGTSDRNRPDFHNKPSHFGFQFGQQNPRGHHFDNFGPRGYHFGPMGPRGQTFGPMGPRAHFSSHFPHPGPNFEYRGPQGPHFGPHGYSGLRGGPHFGHFMGMHGPFESHHFFEQQQPRSQCSPACHEEKQQQSEDHGWKTTLRNAVPVPHRRWAKMYIRNWRIQNLKNATSTSSDSEPETINMEAASVPEAYATWLDVFLPKWHKRLAKIDADVKKEMEAECEEKKKLKASVPVEFRKWTKWYLTRHFGQKEAPRFRKFVPGEEHVDKIHKQHWKRAVKLHTLSTFVPVDHRVWAQKFIHDWRQEYSLADIVTAPDDVLLENEATPKESGQGSVAMPENYAKWMRKCLAKWHIKKGQIDAQKVEADIKDSGELKDSVPKNFRKWVKCYLRQRYSKGAEKDQARMFSQCPPWLQAFQEKWLAECLKEGHHDDLASTSSDEETAAEPPLATLGQTLESAFEKLWVDTEPSRAKKSLHSNPSAKEEEASQLIDDSDSSDIEASPVFQHWGGKTVVTGPDGQEIPAHVVMKVQMKNMKDEFKQAKRAMKAAMKAQKHEHP